MIWCVHVQSHWYEFRYMNDLQTVNVRRRVGDALSVLTAINYVKKTANGYVWIRNDTSRSEDLESNCGSEL